MFRWSCDSKLRHFTNFNVLDVARYNQNIGPSPAPPSCRGQSWIQKPPTRRRGFCRVLSRKWGPWHLNLGPAQSILDPWQDTGMKALIIPHDHQNIAIRKMTQFDSQGHQNIDTLLLMNCVMTAKIHFL